MPRLSGFGMIDLQDFDFLTGAPAFELIRKLLQGKRQVSLIPELDPRSASSNRLSKSLSRLAFRDQLIQEETGEQSLYLAWLFVEGKLINGQLMRAPLILKPVGLERIDSQWKLNSSESWRWNPAFLLAWRHATKQRLPDDFSDEQLENLPADPTEFRITLNQIVQSNFSIQVQSNLFEDRIQNFPNSQIQVDQNQYQEGKLTLKPYAVLGPFAQKGSFLFSDYEELNAEGQDMSLEDLFSAHFEAPENRPFPREDAMFPIFPLDASQENVFLKVRQSKSMVVEGPPGTGKSQLISNLVSDFIARGKKVLVVSQKRAALDVVFERMAKVGFGQFLALVHDFQGDRNLLFEKIKKQIESIEAYQEQNRGIDAIHLEREISRNSRSIARLSDKLEDFRQALFDTSIVGMPIKAMYLNADLEKPAQKSRSLLKLNQEQAKTFEQDFKIYARYQERFEASFWNERKSFAQVQAADFPRISQAIWEVEGFRKQLLELDSSGLAKKQVSTELQIQNQLQKFHRAYNSLQQLSSEKLDSHLILEKEQVKKLRKQQLFLIEEKKQLAQLKFELKADPQAYQVELEVLLSKSQSFFGKLWANLNHSKYPLVFELLKANELKLGSGILGDIQEELQIRIQLQEEKQAIPQSLAIPFSEDAEKDIHRLNLALDWINAWQELGDWHSLLDPTNDLFRQLEIWMEVLEKGSTSWTFWKTWLSESQIQLLLEQGLSSCIPENELNWNAVYTELVAFDRFLLGWDNQSLGLELWQEFPEESTADQVHIFWNGWYLAWISELERRFPVLAEAGSLKMESELEELRKSILEKRSLSQHIALLRLREQMCQHLEYNRLGNRVTYRELFHQVSKKRQRWAIRKLVQELDDEVFKLLPCWLASPETVSALFPLKNQFDLVIFDEASQWPVELGLPAMLRGKQVVIAGDGKQLRPSDFYQVKWESEEEGLEFEAESLLELAGNFFESARLKGHYRSADPALIHFSNTHFYEGQLETLPDYATIQSGKTPFFWEKVEGIWENQVNQVEADAVLTRVRQIQKDSLGDSIGIVTGNYFQMDLIREKLWKEGLRQAGIKVRNIENVQGDEFDQVILSLGYAPNREGKLVTNFGLLSKSGAENRLNVAISRARKQLHLISSINPEDFRPGQLQNPGLSLLRSYLIWVQKQSKQRAVPAPEVETEKFEIDWSLKKKLMESDPTYSSHIPSAVMDLLRVDSSGDQVAILTDDQRFFNSPTAKAALAYHPILLEEKGWKWKMVWSREGSMKA